MTLEKFRILHSTLVEHYQFIEAHLEGIYAAVSGKTLLEGLKDVEKDSIHRILKAIKKAEKEIKLKLANLRTKKPTLFFKKKVFGWVF